MLVKVLIRRQFKPGNQKQIRALLNQLRSGAMNQPGYVSGVTFRAVDDPLTTLVIGTWEGIEQWRHWQDSSDRKNLDAMMEIYQVGPTRYEEYVMGAPAAS